MYYIERYFGIYASQISGIRARNGLLDISTLENERRMALHDIRK